MAGAARTVKQGEREATHEAVAAPVADAASSEEPVSEDGRREVLSKLAPRKPRRAVVARPSNDKPFDLDPIPDNRPSFAWYFRPPIPELGTGKTTGLPADVFYTTSSWQPNQVENQTRKVVGISDTGEELHPRLVLPIDRYGMKARGVPVVALRPPNWTEESLRNWEDIIDLMESARPLELEVEESLLAAVIEDIESGTLTQALRNSARDRQRRLEARIEALKQPVDEPRLFAFFTSESVRSQQTLVNPEQRLTDAIAAGVQAALTTDTARAS